MFSYSANKLFILSQPCCQVSTMSSSFTSHLRYHWSHNCPLQTEPHCSRISAVIVSINHRLSRDHTKIVSLSYCLVLAAGPAPVTSLPGNTGCRKFTACVQTGISKIHCVCASQINQLQIIFILSSDQISFPFYAAYLEQCQLLLLGCSSLNQFKASTLDIKSERIMNTCR